MKLDFTIEGTSELMTHNPAKMLIDARKADSPSKKKETVTPEEEAESGCYRLTDGACALPTLAIRGAMLQAAKDFKVPKKRYSLAKLLMGCDVEPMEFLPLFHNGARITEYAIDSRRIVNKNTGGAMILNRPKYPIGWRVSFSVILDDELFNMPAEDVRATITAVLNDAGRRIGVGSFRPANGGWFGRFKVVE